MATTTQAAPDPQQRMTTNEMAKNDPRMLSKETWTGFGIVCMVIGVLMIIFNIVALAIGASRAYYCMGFWGGAVFIALSVVCLLYVREERQGRTTGYMMSILVCSACAIGVGFAMLGVHAVAAACDVNPDCNQGSSNMASARCAMNSILAALGGIGSLLATGIFILSYREKHSDGYRTRHAMDTTAFYQAGGTASVVVVQNPAQPVYGQPDYTQPVYGQPAYTQPAYGQPGYPQHSAFQMAQPPPYTDPHGAAYQGASYQDPQGAFYQDTPVAGTSGGQGYTNPAGPHSEGRPDSIKIAW